MIHGCAYARLPIFQRENPQMTRTLAFQNTLTPHVIVFLQKQEQDKGVVIGEGSRADAKRRLTTHVVYYIKLTDRLIVEDAATQTARLIRAELIGQRYVKLTHDRTGYGWKVTSRGYRAAKKAAREQARRAAVSRSTLIGAST